MLGQDTTARPVGERPVCQLAILPSAMRCFMLWKRLAFTAWPRIGIAGNITAV
jgi:hypothetical protein